mgnify:FL=1
MTKALRRLTLRLTPDNPIFEIPLGERNKKAEELLRIGYDVQRLERAVSKLENLLQQISTNNPTVIKAEQEDSSDPRLDPKFQKDLKLIRSIMNLGDNHESHD